MTIVKNIVTFNIMRSPNYNSQTDDLVENQIGKPEVHLINRNHIIAIENDTLRYNIMGMFKSCDYIPLYQITKKIM